jgi:hypothetical protein
LIAVSSASRLGTLLLLLYWLSVSNVDGITHADRCALRTLPPEGGLPLRLISMNPPLFSGSPVNQTAPPSSTLFLKFVRWGGSMCSCAGSNYQHSWKRARGKEKGGLYGQDIQGRPCESGGSYQGVQDPDG